MYILNLKHVEKHTLLLYLYFNLGGKKKKNPMQVTFPEYEFLYGICNDFLLDI